jgi:hypothetical protein
VVLKHQEETNNSAERDRHCMFSAKTGTFAARRVRRDCPLDFPVEAGWRQAEAPGGNPPSVCSLSKGKEVKQGHRYNGVGCCMTIMQCGM